ncbi:MAG: DUF1700 domain-containing protein [Clostridia bacterium]|nr:DUF1700 domain-containing protein [Clostridia bacterium]
MDKLEFLKTLKNKLSGAPEKIINESLEYYNEIIDDKIEEGWAEEEAIKELGSIEKIADGILAEVPLGAIVKEKVKARKPMGALSITLLILGSPLWLSLALAAFAVVLSVLVSFWAVVIVLWAAAVSVAACGIGFIAAAIIFTVKGDYIPALAILGMGICALGISIFMIYGCKYVTRGMAWLSKKTFLLVKKLFMGKEKAI